ATLCLARHIYCMSILDSCSFALCTGDQYEKPFDEPLPTRSPVQRENLANIFLRSTISSCLFREGYFFASTCLVCALHQRLDFVLPRHIFLLRHADARRPDWRSCRSLTIQVSDVACVKNIFIFGAVGLCVHLYLDESIARKPPVYVQAALVIYDQHSQRAIRQAVASTIVRFKKD